MRYTILHDIPGRIRVRYAGRPLASAVRVMLDRWVAAHDGIISAAFSTTTRSLLVVYRPECGREKIIDLLQEFSLTEDVVITPPDNVSSPPTFLGSVLNAVFREMAQTLAGAFLPTPIRRVQGACATTRRITVLGITFLDGNLGCCLFTAVKMLALRLASTSLPLRIALRIGFALLSGRIAGPRFNPAPGMDGVTPHRRLGYSGRREIA